MPALRRGSHSVRPPDAGFSRRVTIVAVARSMAPPAYTADIAPPEPAVSRNFVMVDFENVQPSSLGALSPDTCDIKVFTGAHQKKVELALAQALQRFGPNAEWIQITGSGKDALDFHIAFYIGRLSSEHAGASFTIVSRDTGFDPLVKHLAKLGIGCRRVAAIDAITPSGPPLAEARAQKVPAKKAAKPPAKAPKKAVAMPAKVAKAKPARPKPTALPPASKKKQADISANPGQARLAQALELLAGQKHLPAKLSTLRSALLSWFRPGLAESDADELVAALAKAGRISIDGNKVGYRL